MAGLGEVHLANIHVYGAVVNYWGRDNLGEGYDFSPAHLEGGGGQQFIGPAFRGGLQRLLTC